MRRDRSFVLLMVVAYAGRFVVDNGFRVDVTVTNCMPVQESRPIEENGKAAFKDLPVRGTLGQACFILIVVISDDHSQVFEPQQCKVALTACDDDYHEVEDDDGYEYCKKSTYSTLCLQSVNRGHVPSCSISQSVQRSPLSLPTSRC